MKSIIELAKQAGILEPIDLLESNQWRADTIRELEVFARLVRAEVLEEAARLCDGWLHADGDQCATAIRQLKE